MDLPERIHRWMLPVLREVRDRPGAVFPPGSLRGGRLRIPRAVLQH